MGLLDWFRMRKKKKVKEGKVPSVDEEKEMLKRTEKLQTEIEEQIEEKPKRKGKRKKESV